MPNKFNFVILLATQTTLLAGCSFFSPIDASGSDSTNDDRSSTGASEENLTIARLDSNIAENFLRDSLYANTGVLTIVECPDDMSGTEGQSFTCYACPQNYAVAQSGGGYFYGDGSVEFRCDAAYEGFAIDYRVINGEVLLDNGTTRGANE